VDLAALLAQVAAGRPPPPDGRITVLRPPDDRSHGVLAFTGHHIVVADVGPDWVRAELPDGDLSAPLNPPFLGALERATGRRVNNIDAVLVADGLPGPPPVALTVAADPAHRRVARAHRYRADVMAWTCDGGLVLLGRGVAGRWEVAVEVDEAARGRGLGRALFTAARHLVGSLVRPGEPVWAQVAPGNAASLRALLDAGYRPTGAEALLVGPLPDRT
jgi:GNAT superfamily N-acetyltransferase